MLDTPYICTSTASKFSDIVHHLVDPPQRVFLSMYDEVEGLTSEESSRIIRHPDITSIKPVIEGKVKLIIDDPYINKTEVISLELTDPSWKDILHEVNNMLRGCDTPIGFLENIVPKDAGTYQLLFAH